MEKQSLSPYMEFSKERFTKRIIFKKGESTAFVLNFNPGQQLPPHKHPGTEVFLHVLSGIGTFIIDGAEQEVSANDVVHCGGEEMLAFKNNGSGPVSLYVILSKVPSPEYAKDI
ncbi:cupin domain-containing protein [Neobacillus notoginsengisoli]|uniref:Cupin domain-containing protein n=2 Tax=Neobacillus notoginsengisoli TaxID=1578198 RepID=A0A417YET1_9BACI|nr:cupin domain-containing protein [Neobacillus notoginsengisoli]RHW31197.1 cupin domain-containing protein [Neobacillus notoginsengisoli]